MTAIAFVFAWLLAMLTGHPAPSPAAATVPAHVGARLAGRFDPAPSAARPQGSRREDGSRGSTPQAPTSPAAPTYFPETLRTPAWPTVTPPPTDGPERQGPRMCTDPVYCPTS